MHMKMLQITAPRREKSGFRAESICTRPHYRRSNESIKRHLPLKEICLSIPGGPTIHPTMKVLVLLSLVVASQAAAVVYHPAWYPAASAYQAKDSLGNYVFSHHDAHPGGPSFHSESGDLTGRKVGSYGVRDPDGKVRVVSYVADHNGFKADIQTSEKLPEDHKDPANVKTSEVKPVVPVVYAHPFPYYGYPYHLSYVVPKV